MNKVFWLLINLAVILISPQTVAQIGAAVADELDLQNQQVINACLSAAIVSAEADITVQELRKKCEGKSTGGIQERLVLEKSVSENPFAILPHRPNYLLPVSYSRLNSELYEPQLQGNDLEMSKPSSRFH